MIYPLPHHLTALIEINSLNCLDLKQRQNSLIKFSTKTEKVTAVKGINSSVCG